MPKNSQEESHIGLGHTGHSFICTVPEETSVFEAVFVRRNDPDTDRPNLDAGRHGSDDISGLRVDELASVIRCSLSFLLDAFGELVFGWG